MTILRAGPLQIDRQDERAWLQGEPVKLSPKAFGLLSALIAMPGRVVTKSELIETVWEGRAVSDAVLTTAMRELRRALNDNARSPSIIETVHGRGYRFLLEVKSGEVSEGPSAGLGAISDAPTDRSAIGDTAMFSAAAATFILLLVVAILRPFGAPAASSLTETPVKSVAVIPFDDLSGSDEHAWFAGGLTEEILSTLAKTPDLNVISTVALNRSVSAPQVARSRNAAHALTGSVRRASGR
ncbi:MAG: winged helix-turn-helix domain-containing protein, partial [Pseudomonadota bacterium]